jgi:hypothetical protein
LAKEQLKNLLNHVFPWFKPLSSWLFPCRNCISKLLHSVSPGCACHFLAVPMHHFCARPFASLKGKAADCSLLYSAINTAAHSKFLSATARAFENQNAAVLWSEITIKTGRLWKLPGSLFRLSKRRKNLGWGLSWQAWPMSTSQSVQPEANIGKLK